MAEPWYSVRCVLRSPWSEGGFLYEERITIWRVASFEEAVERAERDAREYASDVDAEYVGLAQAYHLAEDRLEDGAEVFSLARVSDLPTNDFLSTFFDTGTERQRHIAE